MSDFGYFKRRRYVTSEERQAAESLPIARPLTTVSDDPNNEPVLTFGNILISKMGGNIAPPGVHNTAFNPRNRLRHTLELTRQENIKETI